MKEGAFMCGYGYSVSDPIFDRIAPGSIVPHGTAEAGGYGLSVTELANEKGWSFIGARCRAVSY